MADEPDIFELLADIDGPVPQGEAGGLPPHRPPKPGPDGPLIDLTIERDLAVMLVGSDAGQRGRIRPHGAMTRGASAQEHADVCTLMRPFLDDEIRRVCPSGEGHLRSLLS